MTTVITAAEAAALNVARHTLDAIKERAHDQARDLVADPDRPYVLMHASVNFGKLAESADHAEAAIFHALNIASSHCHSEEAGEAMDAYNIKAWKLRRAAEATS